jgi:DNA-binding response OmpR family regulator
MAEKKIMIVDYEAQSLNSMAELFKPYKVQIIKAADGLAAYEKFIAEKPDLVILEAILPKIHGFDLTKKISQESRGSVPVVIVTGLYRGPQYKHEALTSFGAADYFEKPLDKERFLASVLNLLNAEEDIEEELPDSTAVIENLSRRMKTQYLRVKKGESFEQA